MLYYLTKLDYKRQIQTKLFDEILGGDDSIRIDSEQTAYEEIQGYISSRYNVSGEFRDVVKFTFTGVYYAGQLVFLDATAYSATAPSYALNDIVLEAGNVYYCKTAILAPEAFTIAKWTLLGPQYKMFYIPLPYNRFDLDTFYSGKDNVFWKDYNYTAAFDTRERTHQDELQANRTEDLLPLNDFPTTKNTTQWTKKTPYSITGLWPIAVPGDFAAWAALTPYVTGDRKKHNSIIWQAVANSNSIEPGTDITKWMPISWVAGDNRNSKMVDIMIAVSLYFIHRICSPRNIPELRKTEYDNAILYLENVMNGKANLRIEEIQPDQNARFYGGSEPKRINRW